MRLRYSDAMLEKLTNLIKEGKSNPEIYKEFGVPNPYSSLANKIVEIKKSLGIPIGRIKSNKLEKSSNSDSEVVDTKNSIEVNSSSSTEDCIKVGGLQVVGNSKDITKEQSSKRVSITSTSDTLVITKKGYPFNTESEVHNEEMTRGATKDSVCEEKVSKDSITQASNGVSNKELVKDTEISKTKSVQSSSSSDVTLDYLVQCCRLSVDRIKHETKKRISTGFTYSEMQFNYESIMDSIIKDLSDLKECMLRLQEITKED